MSNKNTKDRKNVNFTYKFSEQKEEEKQINKMIFDLSFWHISHKFK